MRIPVLVGAVDIAMGQGFSLVLDPGGTLRACGTNSRGQLGDGTRFGSRVPVAVAGLSGIVAIAAGQTHALALRSDGVVWAWGYNHVGQLGDGSSVDRAWPIRVPELPPIAIAASGDVSYAVDTSERLWAWGYAAAGRLGLPALTRSNLPREIAVDRPGPDQGGGLRACRRGLDVDLSWPGRTAALYQVYRDGSKRSLGQSPLGQDRGALRAFDLRAVADPASYFYQVRSRSGCTRTAGP